MACVKKKWKWQEQKKTEKIERKKLQEKIKLFTKFAKIL